MKYGTTWTRKAIAFHLGSSQGSRRTRTDTTQHPDRMVETLPKFCRRLVFGASPVIHPIEPLWARPTSFAAGTPPGATRCRVLRTSRVRWRGGSRWQMGHLRSFEAAAAKAPGPGRGQLEIPATIKSSCQGLFRDEEAGGWADPGFVQRGLSRSRSGRLANSPWRLLLPGTGLPQPRGSLDMWTSPTAWWPHDGQLPRQYWNISHIPHVAAPTHTSLH